MDVLDDLVLVLDRENRLLCCVVSLVVGDGVLGDGEDAGMYGSISKGVGR